MCTILHYLVFIVIHILLQAENKNDRKDTEAHPWQVLFTGNVFVV